MNYYYLSLKVVHILMMATWLGAALSVTIIWSMKNEKTEHISHQLSLQIITRLENITAIVILVVGILMLVQQPVWLANGWLHVKVLLWITALTLSHISRSRLKKLLNGEQKPGKRFLIVRKAMLLCLILAVIMVYFRPF
ncbi:CopD family protein [Candidatus Neomarinimicrobiota bacterium]